MGDTTIGRVTDLLALSAHLPEVEFGPGEVVIEEGLPTGAVWILVSGTLTVRRGGTLVNSISRSGAMVGEISVLLGREHGSTVETAGDCRLRVARDGRGFLDGDPAVMALVAVELAERLEFVSTYLADLKEQYGDTPGISMVSDVLRQLADHQHPTARPGSARDPDPAY